jgi:hypothetical protein
MRKHGVLLGMGRCDRDAAALLFCGAHSDTVFADLKSATSVVVVAAAAVGVASLPARAACADASRSLSVVVVVDAVDAVEVTQQLTGVSIGEWCVCARRASCLWRGY